MVRSSPIMILYTIFHNSTKIWFNYRNIMECNWGAWNPNVVMPLKLNWGSISAKTFLLWIHGLESWYYKPMVGWKGRTAQLYVLDWVKPKLNLLLLFILKSICLKFWYLNLSKTHRDLSFKLIVNLGPKIETYLAFYALPP